MSFISSHEDPDDLSPCPFDPHHMILNKRMSAHIAKCSKRNPNKDMATCPFNALHVVPKMEYQFHILHCADREMIERDIRNGLSQEPATTSYAGDCRLPTYETHPEEENSWDNVSDSVTESFGYSRLTADSNPQVRPPKEEPMVLQTEKQEDIEQRLAERRQQQVAARNDFLRVQSCNKAFGCESQENVPVTKSSPSVLPTVTQCQLAGVGRGCYSQAQAATSDSAAGMLNNDQVRLGAAADANGRGRALLVRQQVRQVSQSQAFMLSNIGRGHAAPPCTSIRPGHKGGK